MPFETEGEPNALFDGSKYSVFLSQSCNRDLESSEFAAMMHLKAIQESYGQLQDSATRRSNRFLPVIPLVWADRIQ